MFSICLPSKGRTERLIEMINSALKQSSGKNVIEFCVYLDSRDSLDLKRIIGTNYNIKIFKGPRLPTSSMTNFMYSQSSGEILMYAADDILFKTQDWDSIVAEILINPRTEPRVLMTNDLSITKGKNATHAFVSRAFCEVLDYLLPPYFESEFCDTWITEIAQKSKTLVYREDLIVEHMHHLWGKANVDETYIYRKSRYRHYELLLYYKIMRYMRKREILGLISKNL